MKRARPPLLPGDLERSDVLLTTGDVARLLRIHPKHVYRLLRRGLPGHRVGGEWRFLADEVRRWSAERPRVADTDAAAPPARPNTEGASTPTPPPPLLASNGDVAVECLLGHLTAEGRPLLGHVQADRGRGLELLRRGEVLAAGCHGDEIPQSLDGDRLAFVRLVDRQIGLAVRRGVALRGLRQIGRFRLASRPPSAGVRPRFDRELRRQGVDPEALHGKAALLPSHREVVCAIARGEADVGLASAAWANRVGLTCMPFYREAYGLLIRASILGDPRIVRLCEVAQSTALRRELGAVCGYEPRLAGMISFETAPVRRRSLS